MAETHVLFVEDDDVIREATQLALERVGFTVTAMPDGLSGLEAFRADRPDIALLDVMVPGLDGVSLCRRIRDESTVMQMLNHQNIVEYYGIEVHRDKVYIFQEYCDGGSLKDLLEHGRIEQEEVIMNYTCQILEGLAYLHGRGIVHRDIKPDSQSLSPVPRHCS